MTADHFILEGILSIQAALESGWREVHEILIDESKRSDRRLNRLRRQAEAADISVSYLPRSTIEKLVSGESHGGAIAKVGARSFCVLDDLIPAQGAAFIVMLDGIEDPYNFAAAVRALYAAGADAATFYRNRGLTVTAAAKTVKARSVYEADLTVPLFLLIGGERRGVTRSFLRTTDLQLKIPYGRDFAMSMGTVGAAAVIAFEVMRQRSNGLT